MSLNEKDKEILTLKFPEETEEDTNYLLTLRHLLETPDFIQEVQKQQMKETPAILQETKTQLRRAIHAASGMRKVIEQLHSDNATVRVAPHEKDLRRAISRVFKSKSDQITFAMYKQAIERLRDMSNRIKDAVIDEQARGN